MRTLKIIQTLYHCVESATAKYKFIQGMFLFNQCYTYRNINIKPFWFSDGLLEKTVKSQEISLSKPKHIEPLFIYLFIYLNNCRNSKTGF